MENPLGVFRSKPAGSRAAERARERRQTTRSVWLRRCTGAGFPLAIVFGMATTPTCEVQSTAQGFRCDHAREATNDAAMNHALLAGAHPHERRLLRLLPISSVVEKFGSLFLRRASVECTRQPRGASQPLTLGESSRYRNELRSFDRVVIVGRRGRHNREALASPC
jgi:hypothetical protein